MGMNGISGMNGLQNYNLQVNIQAPDAAKQPAKTVITEIPGQESRVPSSDTSLQIKSVDSGKTGETQGASRPAANAALEDISVTFNKQDDFGYIGRDSDIHSLDVEKAISDMRKDQILQQYQYFVGSKTVFTE